MSGRFSPPRGVGAILAAGIAIGCGVGAPPASYPDPTSAATTPLRIVLQSPAPYSVLDIPESALTVAVRGSVPIAAVEWSLEGMPFRAAQPTSEETWSFESPLLHGPNSFRVRATDELGRAESSVFVISYAGETPGLRVLSPATGHAGPAGVRVEVDADAAEGSTVSAIEAQAPSGDWLSLQPPPQGGPWTLAELLPLAPEEPLVLRVVDSQDRSRTFELPLAWDAVPPTLEVGPLDPTAAAETTLLRLEGKALDETWLAGVRATVHAATPVDIEPSPDGAFAAEVSIGPGTNDVVVEATDGAGNTARKELSVYRTRKIILSTPKTSASPFAVELDRHAITSMVPEEDAKNITLLYLDLRPLIDSALLAMRDYAAHGVDTSSWGQAEWNLHGLLTMTPDSSNLAGTSLAELMALANNLGLSAPLLLSDITDVPTEEPFLAIDDVAKVVFDNLLSTHPALVADPADGQLKLPVSLFDALNDLAPLKDTLGPQGAHPGIVSALSPTPVLEPHFAMSFSAVSHLTQHEGLDLSAGKSYLFRPPADGPLIELDFLSPEGYQVVGLTSEPRVDLSLVILEDSSFVPAGQEKQANAINGFYKGSSAVWAKAPWLFERVVADVAFRAFHKLYAADGYSFQKSYDVGSVKNAAIVQWDRGWLTIDTVGGVGSPPQPQYIWDALAEIAQVRLHDGGLQEGKAHLELALDGVMIPISADELVEATRPVLEAQKEELAEILVGDFSTYQSDCDVYLDVDDGAFHLVATSAIDVPGRQNPPVQPGLWSDPSLTQKASSPDGAGRERVALSASAGEVFYMRDAAAIVWQLRVVERLEDQIAIELQPAAGAHR